MHYVPVLDAGIALKKTNDAYKAGMEKNVFIKDDEGQALIGKTWPGDTVFPDFFHPDASDYWSEWLSKLHEIVPFDGLWLNMNEVSN